MRGQGKKREKTEKSCETSWNYYFIVTNES